MDGVKAELAKIFRAKEERRHRLARLPFPEKVHAVIQLQNMTTAIRAQPRQNSSTLEPSDPFD